ncbi:hypothetical protein Lser_V15G23577 [Lactuca serriola]
MNPNPFLLRICVTPLISCIHGIDPMRSTSANMESFLCVTPRIPKGHRVDHQRFSILCVLLQMQMKYVEARLGDRVLYADKIRRSRTSWRQEKTRFYFCHYMPEKLGYATLFPPFVPDSPSTLHPNSPEVLPC